MGYTIELSVLHELALRGETAPGASAVPTEAAAGNPPGLVESDSSPRRAAAHTSTGPSSSLPPAAS
jgi:hypothetical protein